MNNYLKISINCIIYTRLLASNNMTYMITLMCMIVTFIMFIMILNSYRHYQLPGFITVNTFIIEYTSFVMKYENVKYFYIAIRTYYISRLLISNEVVDSSA